MMSSQVDCDATRVSHRRLQSPTAQNLVVEIESETDLLKPLRAKMHEYVELGGRTTV